ncbi:MAG: ribonuclease HII [Candidatus Omnitrophica bacterium]|nr:ribonuclease HII [Candidatus Omnitrophota bacterium]MBU4149453.1 ribonuclease HII [Candidatus Omnitrophota bacterium]
MLLWEKRAFLNGFSLIVGIDEAGRGPLAGPVVAAAVILTPGPLIRFSAPEFSARIDDSKKLLPGQRQKAFKEIAKKSIFATGLKDHRFIDKRNILRATAAAMEQAATRLIKEFCRINSKVSKEIEKNVCVLVDGNIKLRLPYRTVRIVRGDSKSLSIAAASIVAKVTRDAIMESCDRKYPAYGFLRHKGYGTKFHIDAIKKYGPCPIHRKTFAPIREA